MPCCFYSHARLHPHKAELPTLIEIGSESADQLWFSNVVDRENGTTETSSAARVEKGHVSKQPPSARLPSDWTESRPRGRYSGLCLFLHVQAPTLLLLLNLVSFSLSISLSHHVVPFVLTYLSHPIIRLHPLPVFVMARNRDMGSLYAKNMAHFGNGIAMYDRIPS